MESNPELSETMMDAMASMDKFLRELGCRKRGTDYILDEWDCEIFLRFDAARDDDNPDSFGTVDIHAVEVARLPYEGLRMAKDCTRHRVMLFMFALGVERFSESTRKFLYASNSVLRTT